MQEWRQFLDSLDSAGGHIVVLVGLLVWGFFSNNSELTIAAMGALFAVLRVGSPPKA